MTNKVQVGDVLSRAFAIYRDQAATLLLLAFGLFLIVGVVSGVATGPAGLLAVLLSMIVSTLYQGTVVRLVEDVEDGRRDYTAGELLRSVAPVLLPLILAGIVVGLLVGIGLVLLIVPGLFLLTIFAVVGPVVVVERTGVFEALARSRELVKGNGWGVFGVIVVTALIMFAVSVVFGVIGAALDNATFVRIVVQWLSSALTAPIWALVAAVLYFDLRDGDDPAVAPGETAAGAPPPPPPPPPPAAPAG